MSRLKKGCTGENYSEPSAQEKPAERISGKKITVLRVVVRRYGCTVREGPLGR